MKIKNSIEKEKGLNCKPDQLIYLIIDELNNKF
jgi:hypothetical protein